MTKRGIKRCLTTRYVCLGICLIYNEHDCWPALRIPFYMACAPLNRMDCWWLCLIRATCSPPFLRTSRAAPLDSREWRDKVIPLQCWKLREYVSPQLSFYTLFWDGSFEGFESSHPFFTTRQSCWTKTCFGDSGFRHIIPIFFSRVFHGVHSVSRNEHTNLERRFALWESLVVLRACLDIWAVPVLKR